MGARLTPNQNHKVWDLKKRHSHHNSCKKGSTMTYNDSTLPVMAPSSISFLSASRSGTCCGRTCSEMQYQEKQTETMHVLISYGYHMISCITVLLLLFCTPAMIHRQATLVAGIRNSRRAWIHVSGLQSLAIR